MVKSNLISDEELDGVSGGVLQATEHTVSVKSSNYLSFIRSASNVAVMFGASWCGPAQIMSETSERFAAKNEQAAVGFVDVDDPSNKKMADAMGITSIPVILYYKNGTLTDRTYGVVPLERMESAFL
jgi:thioredoxin 1